MIPSKLIDVASILWGERVTPSKLIDVTST